MRYLSLLHSYFRASIQQELAYRSNFLASLLHSLLNLGVGVLGLTVLFNQVKSLRGWDFPATLALLGIYLMISAVRDLVFGPSLDALGGLEGEVWTGRFDFTLLRPVSAQFQASFQHWRLFALVDLALGVCVLVAALAQPGQPLSAIQMVTFFVALVAAIAILYAFLLAFAALAFWSPGFMFLWVFNGVYQLARYPVGMYPGWLRMVLTWIVPVGVMTTIPAQALTGQLAPGALLSGIALAAVLVSGSSALFRLGLRRYASASS